MLSITDYLDWIYTDFKNEINTGRHLCDLKRLTFESGRLPDYRNIQIQRLYLLRYAFAYSFEYTHIYAKALHFLEYPHEISVASIGCGTFLDYWALVQSLTKNRITEENHKDCIIRYVGIDEIDWNYKIPKREQDQLYFKKGNAASFFETNENWISDIYFFPKSISEFNRDEITAMVDNFRQKSFLKNKVVFCFSIRSNEYSRSLDTQKTRQIILALENNGFHQKYAIHVGSPSVQNIGIIALDPDYRYPQDAYDYVVHLNEKCSAYLEKGKNCYTECNTYLTRKPTTKTGYITYQIIVFERN